MPSSIDDVDIDDGSSDDDDDGGGGGGGAGTLVALSLTSAVVAGLTGPSVVGAITTNNVRLLSMFFGMTCFILLFIRPNLIISLPLEQCQRHAVLGLSVRASVIM